MHPSNPRTERLFSYGTLQYREVQLATFARELVGIPDTLAGFTLSTIKINGDTSYPALQPTGNPHDIVEGVIFDLTEDELAAADAYEGAEYARIRVRSSNGLETNVYVLAPEA